MKKIFLYTLKNAYSLLMVILSALAVFVLIGLAFGIRPKILVSDSMYPSIYRGSLVLIDIDSSWDSIKIGDVVVFRSGSSEVMHRVADFTEEGLILRPDNGIGDSLVTQDMYAGKELIAFPFIGAKIKPILQHGKGIIILSSIVLFIIGCLSENSVVIDI